VLGEHDEVVEIDVSGVVGVAGEDEEVEGVVRGERVSCRVADAVGGDAQAIIPVRERGNGEAGQIRNRVVLQREAGSRNDVSGGAVGQDEVGGGQRRGDTFTESHGQARRRCVVKEAGVQNGRRDAIGGDPPNFLAGLDRPVCGRLRWRGSRTITLLLRRNSIGTGEKTIEFQRRRQRNLGTPLVRHSRSTRQIGHSIAGSSMIALSLHTAAGPCRDVPG